MPHIIQKLQQAFGTVVLINVIRKEAHFLGFHGHGTTHNPLITKSNHAFRLRWCKALQNWTLDEWKQVLCSDASFLDELLINTLLQSNTRFIGDAPKISQFTKTTPDIFRAHYSNSRTTA
ncbi:transposable element Tc1 transposase [Trichonephila clavipes]|nr:transposable element Tc1 transposase [Trichonephila clavipes]